MIIGLPLRCMFLALAFAAAPAQAQTAPKPVPVPRPPVIPAPSTMRPPMLSNLSPLDLAVLSNRRSSANAYQFTRDFVTCARRRDEHGDRLLKSDVGSVAERRAIGSLTVRHRRCIRRAQPVTVGFIRGAFAEAETLSSFVMPSGRQLDIDRYRKFAADVPALTAENDAGLTRVIEAGRCQAVLAPQAVLAVLNSRAGTLEETRAIDAVFAAAPNCGGRRRPTHVLGIVHRGILAEALYHWLRSDRTRRRIAMGTVSAGRAA